jgi:hypothetical protein
MIQGCKRSITRDSFRLALFERNPEHIMDIIPQLYTSLGGTKMVATLIDTYACHFIGNNTGSDIIPKLYLLAKQMDSSQYKRLSREDRQPFMKLFETTCLELIHNPIITSSIPTLETCAPVPRQYIVSPNIDVREGLRKETLSFIRKYINRIDRELLYLLLNRQIPLQLGIVTRLVCDGCQLKETLDLQGVSESIPLIVLCIWIALIIQETDPQMIRLLRTLYGLFVWNVDVGRWEQRASLLYNALQWYHNPYSAPCVDGESSDDNDDSSISCSSSVAGARANTAEEGTDRKTKTRRPSVPAAIDDDSNCAYLFTLFPIGSTQRPPRTSPTDHKIKQLRIRKKKVIKNNGFMSEDLGYH